MNYPLREAFRDKLKHHPDATARQERNTRTEEEEKRKRRVKR